MSSLKKNKVAEIIKKYCKHRNYSDKTLKRFLYFLNRFDYFMTIQKGVNDYREVSENFYYEYFKYIQKKTGKKNKDTTLKNNEIYLKRVFAILEEEEKILSNPFINIEYTKVKFLIKDKILSEEEINILLNAFDTDNVMGRRDRTAVDVIYCTGIRVNELVNLELADYMEEEKFLFIKNGKGQKDRMIPLGESIIRKLSVYAKETRKILLKKKKSRYLFITARGKKIDSQQITRKISKAAEKAGIKKRVTAHVIRHSFATHLLNGGADIRKIQLLLGHSNIKSTQIYLSLSMESIKKTYEKYHPLETTLYFDAYEMEKDLIEGKLPLRVYPAIKSINIKES